MKRFRAIILALPVITATLASACAPVAMKTVDRDTAGGNDALVYTIVMTNTGSGFVGSHLTDVLPLNSRYNSGPNCDLGVCGYDSGTNAITWTGSISVSDVLTLDYSVLVDTGLSDGTEITNTATVSDETDSRTTNVVTTTIYSPVFTVTKEADGAFVVGAPLTYTLTVTNTSAEAVATGAVVNDSLPSGANYVSGGALLPGGDVISWTIPGITTEGNAQVGFVVTTCQLSLVNDTYQVVTSTQGVTSPLGPALTSNLTEPVLNASFDYVPDSDIFVGDTVSFTDTSTHDGGPIVAWFWDFGDTHTADGSTTSHDYDAPRAYTVTLLITDTCGYTDTSDAPIEVYEGYVLDVTNVGSGNVLKDPDQVTYAYSDVVTLTATADPDWTFAGWDGDLSGIISPITVTMNSSKAVTATFRPVSPAPTEKYLYLPMILRD